MRLLAKDILARVDPRTPIETSIKALAELVEEGKIRGIGLSEVNASTIRKAHAVDPLHNGIMETCHERKSMRAELIGRSTLITKS